MLILSCPGHGAAFSRDRYNGRAVPFNQPIFNDV
jgi:hypothetical protein